MAYTYAQILLLIIQLLLKCNYTNYCVGIKCFTSQKLSYLL